MPNYIAETMLHAKHLYDLFNKGKTKIHRSDLETSGGELHHLHFHKLKDMNAYKRNLSAGKPFTLTTQKIHDITDASGGSILGSVGKFFTSKPVQNIAENVATNVISDALVGGSLFSSAKSFGKSALNSKIGQSLAKQAINEGAKAVSERTGSDLAGQVAKLAGQHALESASGSGLFSSAKSFGKSALNSKIGQSLAKQAINEGAKAVSERTGSDLAGQVAKLAGQHALESASGSGLFSKAKSMGSSFAGSKLGQQLGKIALKESTNYAQENYGDLAGNMTNLIGQHALNSAQGGGGLAYGLGGTRLSNSFANAKERMAWVRSHRKVGGSIMPLGST